MKMYENRTFKRDAFIKVTRRRFRYKRSETRASFTNPVGNPAIKIVVQYPATVAAACSTLYVDDVELIKEEILDHFTPGGSGSPTYGWTGSNTLTSPAVVSNALRVTNNTPQEGFKRNITLAAKAYTFSFYMDKGWEDLNDKEYFSVDIINSSNAIVYTYTTKVNATGYYNFDYSATTAGTYTWRFRRVSLNGRSTSGIAYFDDFKVSSTIQQSQQVCSSPKNYRFGFNGMEKESDMYGESNVYDFGARIHDARIGRFLSVDPLTSKYPELTPYQFASNTPIQAVDLDGLETYFIHGTQSNSSMWTMGLTTTLIKLFSPKDQYNYDASYNWKEAYYKYIFNNEKDRLNAAKRLASHIYNNRKKRGISNEPITLIGHSHGGNVNIQAVEILRKKYRIKEQINIINFNTPAFNGKNDLENPMNANLENTNLVHFYTNGDNVAGTASNNKYSDLTFQDIKFKGTNTSIIQRELQQTHNAEFPRIGLGSHYMSNISTLEVGKLVEGIVGAIGNIFSGGSSKSDAGTDKIMLNPRF